MSTRYLPVPHWPQYHAWPTVSGLRWLIFNAKALGFDKVIKRVNRRILIDEEAFFQWVEEQNQKNA